VHPITTSRLPSPAAALFDPGQSQSSAGIHSIIHSASRLRLLPARVDLSPCMPAGSIIDFPDHASCQFRCSLLIVGACARKSLFVFFLVQPNCHFSFYYYYVQKVIFSETDRM
jgi:hypothetical protein